MPVVDGLPVPVLAGQVAPGCTGPGPPEHSVDHLPVIDPSATPAGRTVRQQRLQPGPFGVRQVMSVKRDWSCPSAPPDRNLIQQTGPSRAWSGEAGEIESSS